jgi:hypothetical protein
MIHLLKTILVESILNSDQFDELMFKLDNNTESCMINLKKTLLMDILETIPMSDINKTYLNCEIRVLDFVWEL